MILLATRSEGLRELLIRLDEQGRVRTHMKVFVNQDSVRDLGAVVDQNDEVTIMQALSGGG